MPRVLDDHAGVYERSKFCSNVAPRHAECSPCVSVVVPADEHFVLLHVASAVLAESIDGTVVSISVRRLSHEGSQQPIVLVWTQKNPSLRLLPKRLNLQTHYADVRQ